MRVLILLLMMLMLPMMVSSEETTAKSPGRIPGLTVSELPSAGTSGNGGLFVGVGEFPPDSGLTKLNYTVSDAIALCHVFVEELKLIPASQATLAIAPVPNPEPPMLATLRASGVKVIGAARNEIVREVRRVALFPRASEDLVVVTVSTHGFEKDGAAYVMPTDGDAVLFTEMGIPIRTLETVLRGNPASTKHILIIDACRERPEGESRGNPVMTGGFREALQGVTGTAILASCDVGQLSWEARDLGHGVYTHFLLEGLRGKAAAPLQPYLRLGDVASYATRQTEDWVSRQRGQKQVPWTAGETAREIPLAINPEGVEAVKKAEKEAERLREAERLADAERRAQEQAEAEELARLERERAQALERRIEAARARLQDAARNDERFAAARPEIDGAVRRWKDVLLTALLEEIEALDPADSVSRNYFLDSIWPPLAEEAGLIISSPNLPSGGTSPGFETSHLIATSRARREERLRREKLEADARAAIKLLVEVDRSEELTAQEKLSAFEDFFKLYDGQVTIPEMEMTRRRLDHWKNWRPPTPTPSPSPRPTPVRTTTATPRPTAPSSAPAGGSINRPGTRAGDRATVTVNGVEFAFRWCPPGTFTMGSPSNESGRDSDEGPQTQVTLTSGFWMGETEVTQAQWKAVMGVGNNPSRFKGDTLPVETVSWNDIMGEQSAAQPQPRPGSFMERLRAALGGQLAFTLPTEAQWEYACRAGMTTRFYFGDSDSALSNHGWFTSNSGGSTKAVGSKGPNPWGLQNMPGNVWEWTSSWFGDYPGGSQQDYIGGQSGSHRVSRGGSWADYALLCRSATRFYDLPTLPSSALGFRVLSPVQ